ncbi:hypothetical protein [Maribacter sp. 2210JD10-5]|uniref:hypothetical protein n=1 Tax=Maribacter sp. 2210JD10-5 TaxID=3386272 RepID=UPI0039BCE3EC
MACLINSGRKIPCKDTLGGLVAAYFINYIEEAFTVVNGEATALNVGVTEAFKYELRNDGNILSESPVSDKNTGTTVNTQTLNLVLPKLDKETSLQVSLLAKGRPVIVVQGRDGSYKVAGLSEGMDLTGSDINSGGAHSDFSGYNLTFTSMEGENAPFLDEATITALLAIVSATNIEA